VLKSWPLAITAYNHGIAGVRRAVRETGTDDLGEIAKRYETDRPIRRLLDI
jgi:membrane-bound lytic murein transglycosylase D